ncbi:MAG: hypothetical protein JW993_16040 [Sedimentisphaerales bacterium]|nr:hypothetical protein [Sedimentisphaerales bacterium]
MARDVTRLVVTTVCITALGASAVDARGLLGERYGSLQLGVTRPGNSRLRSIDSSVIGFGAGLNVPVTGNVDLAFVVSREELSGGLVDVESTSFQGGANYLISPESQTCPFLIGRLGIVDTSPGDSDPMIALGGGIEFDLNDKAALTPSLVFVHIDDADDLILSGEGNYWITERVFGLAGLGIGLDEGDIVFTIGAGLQF